MKENKIEQGNWPRKYNLFGIEVSATNYDELLHLVLNAAKINKSICVSHLAVHGLIMGSKDSSYKNILNRFEIIAPDGMPLRFAIDWIHNTQLPDRVYGPEFMLRVCRRAASDNIGVYLYGSHRQVVETLKENLITKFNELKIAGCDPSVFRPLTKAEDESLVRKINDSGAGIVFLGLGCPLQERFAYEHRKKIKAVQICVGAAFDFHAGNKKMAPAWMQKYSLEWLFRLLQEPSRLWQRYLFTNTAFVFNFFLQCTGLRKFRRH